MTILTSADLKVTRSSARAGRVAVIDVARGIALVGMIVFHIARDLEMFGVVAPGTTLNGVWYAFARLIAGSFLFLVGVSLVLAHGDGIRWAAFGRRALIIAAAALAVSAATYAAMPERFVYFGILHAILVASCAGIVLVQAPAWASVLVACTVLAIWHRFGRSLDIEPWLGWTGLAAWPRPALDLIPVFPWLAVTFLGIALARTVSFSPRQGTTGRIYFAMSWLGRHSLGVYLLHQPILVSTIWLVLFVLGQV